MEPRQHFRDVESAGVIAHSSELVAPVVRKALIRGCGEGRVPRAVARPVDHGLGDLLKQGPLTVSVSAGLAPVETPVIVQEH